MGWAPGVRADRRDRRRRSSARRPESRPHRRADRLGLDGTDRRMRSKSAGVSALERVEALLANPALYELAELIPEPDHSAGGRRRDYPTFMWLLYEALISVYGSARRVEAERAHPLVWRHVHATVRRQHPRPADLYLPEQPMRRH